MRCVIVGNGVAAVEAAITLRQADRGAEITVVSDESGLPFSRPALMYVFMGQLRFQDTLLYDATRLKELNLNLLQGRAIGLDTSRNCVVLDSGNELSYDQLLIATGSRPKVMRFQGHDNLFGLRNVCGFYHLRDLSKLDQLCRESRRAVITGGGLIGIEVAEMLQSRGLTVDFVVREQDYWRSQLPAWEARRLSQRIRRHGIQLHLGSEVASLKKDGEKIVEVHTSGGRVLPNDLFVISIGVEPNIAFLSGSDVRCKTGVLVDAHQRTSAPNVYAAGDCAELQSSEGASRIEKVWYTAKAQGKIAGLNLAGQERRYEPGLWFNSAKFFDLEYQVYGEVPVKDLPGDKHYLTDVDLGNAMWRVIERGGRIIGMSAFGIRLRHREVERVIQEGRDWPAFKNLIESLSFDSEFSRRTYNFRETTADEVPER